MYWSLTTRISVIPSILIPLMLMACAPLARSSFMSSRSLFCMLFMFVRSVKFSCTCIPRPFTLVSPANVRTRFSSSRSEAICSSCEDCSTRSSLFCSSSLSASSDPSSECMLFIVLRSSFICSSESGSEAVFEAIVLNCSAATIPTAKHRIVMSAVRMALPAPPFFTAAGSVYVLFLLS